MLESTDDSGGSMSKARIANNVFPYPMPMTLVGAEVDGKPNFLAAAWITRCNPSPPLVLAALGKMHHTNRGIREHREFSVNIPSVDMLKLVDHAGLVSGSRTDKSGLFETFCGDLKHAPMAKACGLAMECRLVQVVELAVDELFIGEIVSAFADEECLVDGKPDVRKLNPFTLTMPDNRYWAVGDELARAWSAGKELIQR
jgi:flavin reductase (DIM6/NTAB) family NADH-FMN oxidoreductase RutF